MTQPIIEKKHINGGGGGGGGEEKNVKLKLLGALYQASQFCAWVV